MKLICECRAHQCAVYALAFNSDGTLLASGDYHDGLCLWEPSTGRLLNTLRTHTAGYINSIFALAFSPDSSVLASGRGGVQLWDIATRTEFFHVPTSEVASLAWKPDSTLFAYGNEVITICDGRSGAQHCILDGAKDWIVSLAWSSDGKWLAAGSYMDDGRLFIWEVETERLHAVLPNPKILNAANMVFDGNHSLLFTDGYARLFRWVFDTQHLEIVFEKESTAYTTALSPDGRLLVYRIAETLRESGARDRLCVVDTLTGRELGITEPNQSEFTCMALSNDHKLLAAADQDGRVFIYELSDVTL
ncbi:MAG: hypothetical protein K8L99_20345 [Anaerolineae bacterium]|nr:hypothetical protein [Anaerolineae bacterium]